ncbi:SAM-dependent methyltransferase [Amycolatopsis suaedae]|uniref:S-adenosyl-L-methionine-dependent methyltransferase n=1 Tax=Amycolatopsis suaedae TaxID=2510978 RepID=A0A4Q7J3D3_9PSEU|nr:SAM-dependent methyltransferase [Amycolatopsis suaedae]RZQ61467.1 SAM-dependent methyltransferase [Amycolatopsis suaedae]
MNNPAAQTALGPMVIVAVDQHENPPLVHDGLAGRMLPRGGRLAVAAARWRPVRRALINATERRMPGLWASMLCRKRYIDDIVERVAPHVAAAVILGAGFDTRAYRLPALAGMPVYEVDQPLNIRRKRAALAAAGRRHGGVTLVPVDFQTQQLAGVLAGHGYRATEPTVFVWEAVTQYLTEDAVRATFDFLAAAPAGSHLVFTYIRQDFLDGTALYGAEPAYHEFVVKRRLWHFGMHPERVAGFLAGYGWTHTEQLGPAEFAARYVTPSGRNLPVSEIERCVHATKN